VFEHLKKPDEALNEFHRVLKPGGHCAIVTPNRYDYSSLVARVTPQSFHEYFIRNLYGRDSYDSFPVFYRANTPRYFEKHTLDMRRWTIVRISGLRHYPANLSFSRILFQIGILYDKLLAQVNCVSLQPSLLVVLEKATPLSEETAAEGNRHRRIKGSSVGTVR
jgi:SAM-dependent methyltransferase